MASQRNLLTKKEIDIFRNNELEDDIPSVERRIGKRLNHHQAKWTTLGSEYQEPKHDKVKPGYEYQPEQTIPDTIGEAHSLASKPASKEHTLNSPIKIVLLGPEGAGKSALGNLLIGNKRFKVATTREPGQQRCESEVFTYDYEWEVVDTPGKPFTEETTSKGKKLFMGMMRQSINPELDEIKKQVKQADVIIFVLNTSFKRTPDMGIKAFREMFPEHLSETGMLVTTHGDTHYRMKGTTELLDDLNESPKINEFLYKISHRVIIVELGDGQQSDDAVLDGNAVYDKERDQARDMVMAMVKHIMQNRNAPKMRRHSSDPKGEKGRPLPLVGQASQFV